MFKSPNKIAHLRTASMGLTGLVCLIYGFLVLFTEQPNPISPWIPGLFGVATAIIACFSFLATGSKTSETAPDKSYLAQNHRVLRIGYWVALLLYPAFGLLIMQGVTTLELAFPAMGTFTAAAYLIPFAFLTRSRSRT